MIVNILRSGRYETREIHGRWYLSHGEGDGVVAFTNRPIDWADDRYASVVSEGVTPERFVQIAKDLQDLDDYMAWRLGIMPA